MNLKLTITTLALIFFSYAAFAQCDESTYRNYFPAINKLAINDHGVMLAITSVSPLMRSEDNGKTWSNVDLGELFSIKGVFFTSEKIAYLYADKVVLKSEDAGKTWFPLVLPAKAPLDLWNNVSHVFFIYDDKGFVFNQSARRLYSTLDGGRSFSETRTDDLNISSVHFANSLNGIFFYSQKEFSISDDGGKTWVAKEIPLPQSTYITDMKIISKDTLFAILNNGDIKRSTNGGDSWTVQHNYYSPRYNDQLEIVNALELYVLTEYELLRSLDGGNTWETAVNQTSPRIYGISLSHDKLTIAISGGGYTSGQFIAVSSNKGQNWDTLSYFPSSAIAMDFANQQNGYAVANYNYLFKTDNGGITWKQIGDQIPYNMDLPYAPTKKIKFINASTAYLYNNSFYTSTDSGKSWQAVPIPPDYAIFGLEDFEIVRDSILLLANNYGIHRTTNKGITWTKVLTYNESILRDIHIDEASGIGLAIGGGNSVKRTQDFGATWQIVNFPYDDMLATTFVADQSLAFIGGTGRRLYRSTNGGVSWQSRLVDNYNNVPLKHFLFSGKDTGIVVSGGLNFYGTRTFKTYDGGNSWEKTWEMTAQITQVDGTPEDIKYLDIERGMYRKMEPSTIGVVGYINGKIKTCVGYKGKYIVHPVSGAKGYNWTVTGNALTETLENENYITWQTPGIYQIQVTAFDDCSVSAVRTLEVEVVEFVPVLEKVTDTTIVVSGGKTTQWFYNNHAASNIYDSVGPLFKPQISGLYAATVTNELGCTLFTNNLYFIKPSYFCTGQNIRLEVFSSDVTNFQWQIDEGNGYVDLVNNTQFSGVNGEYLYINQPNAHVSGKSFRCRYLYYGTIKYGGETKIIFTNTWQGNVNADWENPLNWSCRKVPDETTEVSILTGNIQIQSNVTVKKLYVAPGASVNVLPGYKLDIKG